MMPCYRVRAGLEAGALLASGVVGAHYLGLGHHSVLLLREGIAMCHSLLHRVGASDVRRCFPKDSCQQMGPFV